jgi:hypothetical protein
MFGFAPDDDLSEAEERNEGAGINTRRFHCNSVVTANLDILNAGHTRDSVL